MESVTTICVFLVMFGTGQTNDLKREIYSHGDNATVLIEKLQNDGRKSLDIYFNGFTNKPHYTHVMLIGPNTNNDKQISRNYTGRIKNITLESGNLSFVLLNVNFMDSGNYTVFDSSVEKGKQSIFVTRRRLTGQINKTMILSFICNNTNTSSIQIRRVNAFDFTPYINHDVARNSCTHTNVSIDYKGRIESCVLNDTNFYLTLKELIWSDKGAYTAWDDQGFLLDSINVCIPDNNISCTEGTSSPDSSSPTEENETIWYLVSSVVVLLVAAFLATMTVRKLRQAKAPKTTTNNLTHRNGSPNIANSSRNRSRNFEEATSSKQSAMILTKINNVDDPTDFTNSRGQGKVKPKEKHDFTRGLNSKSPMKTTSKLQMHSSVSSTENFQSETTSGYNTSHKCVKLKNECRSVEPYLSSTESIAGPSFEYDYAVQGTCLTSRAKAHDPVETKQNKGKVMIDDTILWHKKVHKKSSSRVDPSTLYAKVNKKTAMKTHCTDFNAERGSRELKSELTAPRTIELQSAADLKSQGASHGLNYELARNVSDDSSVMELDHRESQ